MKYIDMLVYFIFLVFIFKRNINDSYFAKDFKSINIFQIKMKSDMYFSNLLLSNFLGIFFGKLGIFLGNWEYF